MTKSIDDYISEFPKPTQQILEKIREVITKVVPDAEEAMTYGIPTFKLNGKNLVHFAGFKNHIGFYPTPSGIAAFKKEFKKLEYEFAKGSVKFPLDQDIPYELIKKIAYFRVKEL